MPALLGARTSVRMEPDGRSCLRTITGNSLAGHCVSRSGERRRPARLGSILSVVAGLMASALPLAAAAQDFPVRPVRVIVGFSPGGAPDLIARQVAEPLGARFGHTFVVDNRAGANGVIGADIVSRANPDGHTLLVTSASFAISPSIYRKLPYDPVQGFAPVTNIALGGGLILCINANSPILVTGAKPRTGSYGSLR